MAVKYRRGPDICGHPWYDVVGDDGSVIGSVWRRRGGWWRSETAAGHLTESWALTRREATDSLVRWLAPDDE